MGATHKLCWPNFGLRGFLFLTPSDMRINRFHAQQSKRRRAKPVHRVGLLQQTCANALNAKMGQFRAIFHRVLGSGFEEHAHTGDEHSPVLQEGNDTRRQGNVTSPSLVPSSIGPDTGRGRLTARPRHSLSTTARNRVWAGQFVRPHSHKRNRPTWLGGIKRRGRKWNPKHRRRKRACLLDITMTRGHRCPLATRL